MGGYGYKSRTDPDTRVVPAGSGESRVATPGNQEARRTDIAAKTTFAAPAATPLDAIVLFPGPDSALRFLGKNVREAVIGALPTQTWQADILRYAETLFAGVGVQNDFAFKVDLEPRSFIDPILPPSGIIVKVRDVVRAKFAGAMYATQQAQACLWLGRQGFFNSNVIATDNNRDTRMGFQAIYTVAGVQPTWNAYYSGIGGAQQQRVDSGVTCDVPRLLEIVMDGAKQEARFYVDRTLVLAVSPGAGTAPQGATSNGAAGSQGSVVDFLTVGNGNTGTTQMDFLMGGYPLVTYQFPDV